MIKRGLVVIGGCLAVFGGGCAQETLPSPSFLGMSEVAAEERSDAAGNVEPALRHINSNRVLGAMAFQKVTGRSVDPQSLVGSGPSRD